MDGLGCVRQFISIYILANRRIIRSNLYGKMFLSCTRDRRTTAAQVRI